MKNEQLTFCLSFDKQKKIEIQLKKQLSGSAEQEARGYLIRFGRQRSMIGKGNKNLILNYKNTFLSLV